MPKVCFCVPTYRKPQPQMLKALEEEIPLVREAGWEECSAWEVGHAYISYVRILLLQKAIESGADTFFFIDDDVSWKRGELLKVLQAKGDVVGATYRFKSPIEEYMGHPLLKDSCLQSRSDGAILMQNLPMGMTKISRTACEMMIEKFPALDFSRTNKPYSWDLWNHGTIGGVWFGEDYAFCLRWRLMRKHIWCLPNIETTHNGINSDGKEFSFPGNYYKWLLKQEKPKAPLEAA